ncbi:cupin domain-containing protein [Niveispirillum sp. KHB5.9]|uniref:cupin domain-containing protein n=1 Tax=Niveispirillum sp. KHB5.9 TaxID=3400269 RepID=UPI003A8C4AF6
MERVFSFIDLRAFAADALAQGAAGGSWLEGRVELPLAPGPVTLSALRLAPGRGEVPALAGDEFVLVLTGSLTLAAGGVAVTLGPDGSAVVPRGLPLSWLAPAGATALVMRSAEEGGAGADALVAIDNDAPLSPSGAPLAELLLTPTPACRNNTLYTSASGTYMAGIWDSTPYHRRAMRYRHFELMLLLEGSVTFVDGAGREATFAKGDIFLVEQGADCSWESREQVKKVFAIYRPA